MPTLWILATLAVLAICGYLLARRRALVSAGGDARALHSRPNYYGMNAAILVLAPALLLYAVLSFAVPVVLDGMSFPQVAGWTDGSTPEDDLLRGEIARIAEGLDTALASGAIARDGDAVIVPQGRALSDILSDNGTVVAGDIDAARVAAALRYRANETLATTLVTAAVLLMAVAGLALAILRTTRDFRARNAVETAVRWTLIAAASIAILTTLGIVLSLIFNTVKFFGLYPASDFFLGTTWSPSFGGGSSLGFLPLLWGTLYISLIALVVAVPIGLFAAVYLSEYASRPVRAIAKPMLEVLAGIPTIVYGLFALLTVGPLLVEVFGQGGLLGVGWMRGGTSVMTAGLVMGIMLIPFVSSLSDDIINAVPQSMRDGSLGLGATPSETIRSVVLPAALPGIVGAILLAASRAIGETMIVVLGAGAAARLSLNPFEAMTTVTAKIVSQLTGDSDFNSPEALVAFALGMSLFVITLGLNVFALWIVRRYREQYE